MRTLLGNLERVREILGQQAEMYKVLEEVRGSSGELLVGAQVITRERVLILYVQESLEKMEPEVDRKEEALNEDLKALIGEETG